MVTIPRWANIIEEKTDGRGRTPSRAAERMSPVEFHVGLFFFFYFLLLLFFPFFPGKSLGSDDRGEKKKSACFCFFSKESGPMQVFQGARETNVKTLKTGEKGEKMEKEGRSCIYIYIYYAS